ncbi:MAG: Maf family protein [Ignavibacteriaceae bacterium]|nr:Maf family protein [Ignavibacteriaceae bacterium]
MIKTKQAIYLASKSPRRRKLLEQVNLVFKVVPVDTPEVFGKKERPANAVRRIALEKLYAAKEIIKDGIIITADTIVVIKGKIIGKPLDNNDAVRMLKQLSGKTHIVYTGFSVYNSVTDKTITDYEKTYVTFRKLNGEEIKDYVKTGSPLDKAGAYGIQDDYGAVFIKKINGCYYNVVGLPLTKVFQTFLRII